MIRRSRSHSGPGTEENHWEGSFQTKLDISDSRKWSVREKDKDGKRHQKNCEIDFIARKGNRQVYIQSAYSMADPLKEEAELRPLLAVRDFHKKVVVSQSVMPPWVDESGVLRLGIYDFLLDESLIE